MPTHRSIERHRTRGGRSRRGDDTLVSGCSVSTIRSSKAAGCGKTNGTPVKPIEVQQVVQVPQCVPCSSIGEESSLA